MERLVVQNFGAIQYIDIELKNLSIFIGKSGTGKSTLAKLIAIFRDYQFWVRTKTLEEYLADFRIDTYLNAKTCIEYENKYWYFKYENNSSKFDPKDDFLDTLFSESSLSYFVNKSRTIQSLENINFTKVLEAFMPKSLEIPAERHLVTSLSESYAVLDKENIIRSLPKTLLDFVAEFNDISKVMNGTVFPMFNIIYEKDKNGRDYLILADKTRLLLSASASGMQTAIPTLLVLEYYARKNENPKNFIFEEPELNLFPSAQKAFVEFLIERVVNRSHRLVICTHSPYILTSLNNLLYAHQIQRKFPASQQEVAKVIAKNTMIASEDVAVYYLVAEGEFEDYDTYVVDLLDKETGLISGNELDSISEYINEDFEDLIEIYREHQRRN